MTRLRFTLCAVLLLLGRLGAHGQSDAVPAIKPVQHPDPDIGALSLEVRQRRQLAAADELTVEHGFSFTDSRRAASPSSRESRRTTRSR